MSRLTTEWPAMTDPAPMVTPGRTVTLAASHTLSPITVGPLYKGVPGSSSCRLSSMTDTLGAIMTLSPIRTSCHESMLTP